MSSHRISGQCKCLQNPLGVSEKRVSVTGGCGCGLTLKAELGAFYRLNKCSPASNLPYCVVAWKVFLILDAFIHPKIGRIPSRSSSTQLIVRVAWSGRLAPSV